MKMEFNSSFSSSSRGDDENQGENTHVPAGTERLAKKKKIRLLSTRAEEREGNEAFSDVDVKLEVPETPLFQSDDEAEFQIASLQINTNQTDIHQPKTLSTSQNHSKTAKTNEIPARTKKFTWNCRHCHYKSNNRFSYADHLKTHLPGSTASGCDACKVFFFPEDLKGHEKYHQKSVTSGSIMEYYSSDDENEEDSSNEFTSDDDQASKSSFADDNYDASQQEVVDLGHFSSTPVFMDEDEEYDGGLESEPIPINGNNSRRSSSNSNTRQYHVCPYCPYESLFSRCVEKHLELHSEKANSAAPCRRCGAYVSFGKKCACGSTPKKKKLKMTKKQLKMAKKKQTFQHYSVHVRTMKSQPTPEYKCNHCPYTVLRSVSTIESHAKLHRLTSRAIPCDTCGVFVLPERMGTHKGHRHPVLTKGVRRKLMEVNRIKKEPNRDFHSGKDSKNQRFYKCHRCGLRTNRLIDMEAHVELHKEGSGAVPCTICNQIMLPEQMQAHLEANHTVSVRQQRPDRRRVKNPSLQCAQCPHQSKMKRHAEQHSLLHLEGSGAIPCQKCGVFIRDIPYNSHRLHCIKYQNQQRMKAKLIANQEGNSSGSLNSINTAVESTGDLE